MKIYIAPYAESVLQILHQAGFEAYVVGGCVRDSLLGMVPHDWDITTNAKPHEMMQCFQGMHVVPTGLQHGTVTVFAQDKPIEVTTYRIDGEYSDHRRPDRVLFTENLTQDLARRDFTMNAMAYSPLTGLCDPFGGYQDLLAKRIVCVGEADARFQEDALRILRAARFASTLELTIENNTFHAMLHNRSRLQAIAAERVFSELVQTLTGKNIYKMLIGCTPLFTQILPEIEPCIGFAQHNSYHHLDIWEHTALAVHHIPPEPVLRLTMLLHDLGKPFCFFQDAQGVGHFYGHEQKSAELASRILRRLRCDKATRLAVKKLIEHHNEPILPQRKSIRRKLAKLGENTLRQLIAVQLADGLAKSPAVQPSIVSSLQAAQTELEKLLAEQACFSLQNLAVSGRDLLELGFQQGKQIGDILHALLEQVVSEKLPNQKEALLQAVKNEYLDKESMKKRSNS